MRLRFGILCFPGVQHLDLAGPHEVFASATDTTVHLIWKNCDPLEASSGLVLTPDTCFSNTPALDVLCIPGGGGVNALLTDQTVLDFVREKASEARFVTSVCTGALVLGMAGLLEGRRAATHWNAMDLLPRLGAIPVSERVVRDGNLITAGGVTSGIDFGLIVIGEMLGRQEAEIIQLMLEYEPAPPFDAGSPATASSATIDAATARTAASRSQRKKIIG